MKAIPILLASLLLFGCLGPEAATVTPPRNSTIPVTAIKISPGADIYPPVMHSGEFEQPIPLGLPVDTAGAEDSPFITPDGNTLYFFFTPDPSVPAEQQLFDNVTGIWVSRRNGSSWSEPTRVILQDSGKLSLDGCQFVEGNTMWFCSAREGYTGLHWFTAEYKGGKWQGWKNADFNDSYGVGELHISRDNQELIFHSMRPGGKGGLDLWISRNVDGIWQEPENLAPLNSDANEGWPYLSQDMRELWFLRVYLGSPAIFRSMRTNGSWSEPELIVSQFAGEPSLDNDGNLYFVHHFYKDGQMLEADIYMAKRKKS